MGGGGKTTQTTVQQDPYFDEIREYIKPYVNRVQAGVGEREFFDKGPVGWDQYQQQAYDQASGVAGQQDTLAKYGTDALQGYITGDSDALGRLSNQAAQRASGVFGSSGTFGSGRAANAASSAAAQTIAENQLKAIGMIGNQQDAQARGLNTLNTAGTLRQQQDQRQRDWEQQRFDFYQNEPYEALRREGQLLGLPYQNAPKTTTQTTQKQPSPLEAILGIYSTFTGGNNFLKFAGGGEIPQGSQQSMPMKQRKYFAGGGVVDGGMWSKTKRDMGIM